MQFIDLLTAAVNRHGSVIVVARLLRVDARTLSGWMAGERPAPAEEVRCRAVLRQRAARPASAAPRASPPAAGG
jgi:hypothetical protein